MWALRTIRRDGVWSTLNKKKTIVVDCSLTYNDSMDVRDGFKRYLGEKDKQICFSEVFGVFNKTLNYVLCDSVANWMVIQDNFEHKDNCRNYSI